MSSSSEFSSFIKQVRTMLLSIDNYVSKPDRAKCVKQLITFILENQKIIIREIQSMQSVELRYNRFYRLLNSFATKGIQVHNELIQLNLGDAESLQLCRRFERFGRLQIIKLLKRKPTVSDTFLESPYVRRSPRFAKQPVQTHVQKRVQTHVQKPVQTHVQKPVQKPVQPHVQLRRSARLANKARA